MTAAGDSTCETEPMLDVESLGVRYGPVIAVDNVNLRLDSPGIVAVVGPNGAGKSSLLRGISRIESSTGRIEFLGCDVSSMQADKLARMGLVHVPEGRRIIPDLTTEENLRTGTFGRGNREEAHTLKSVFELFPQLADLRARKGGLLSGGEQQMLALGRGLLAQPRVLMIDEPTLGLSPLLVRRVFEAIEQLAATIPILLIEQNVDLALEVAREAHVMVDGRFLLSGRPDDFPDRAEVLRSYMGEGSLVDAQVE